MAPNYRRGSAAIEDAATRRGSADFRPFLPQIIWKNDGESKYILVITDIEAGVYELLLHQFVPIGKGTKANGEEFIRYEDFTSRKDPALGEDYDDLEDRLNRQPKTRIMGVLVELEAVLDTGTKKLNHFVAKTERFTRNTTDGEVEVTAPVIGFCTQSAVTLWGSFDSLWKSLGDLTQVPIQVTRRGKDQNTRYDTIPFMEKPVDLSPVIEYLDGIGYIGDDLPELLHVLEAEDGDLAKVQVVSEYLLDKRVNELADATRYEELVGPLGPDDMPKNPYNRKEPTKATPARPARPTRHSPRPQANGNEPEAEVVPAAPSKNEKFAALKSRVESRG